MPIVERGMQSEDGKWDPATITGIKSSDRILVIGNAAFMPWLAQVNPDNVVEVRKVSEIETLLRNNEHFDKIIVAREVQFTNDHILRAGAFKAQLIVFPTDDGWQFDQAFEFYYAGANVWKFESTFGPVIVAEPVGVSWRMLYA